MLALWWTITRPGARVVLTAPANHQIENILWPELRLIYSRARVPLGGHLYEDPRKGLRFGDKWGIFGLTTDSPERIAGLSGEQLMFLVDEASGYPEDLYTAIFGNLAGGGKVFLFGNPTRTSGTFFNAFHGNRGHWHTIHIRSTETPNFTGGRVPGLATPEWVDWAKREWGGEDSVLFKVRVLGQFPDQGANSIVAMSAVEDAKARWATASTDGTFAIGVDVARFGDDETIIQPVRGSKPLKPIHMTGADTVQVAGRVIEYIKAHRVGAEKPIVKVDTIGVGGGVADHLRQHHGSILELVEVNVSERSNEEADFVNLRSELWFNMARWIEANALHPDPKLEAELLAPTYNFDNRGRRRVEPKEDIKKRLGRSPDRADALALAVYQAPRAAVHVPLAASLGYRQASRGF